MAGDKTKQSTDTSAADKAIEDNMTPDDRMRRFIRDYIDNGGDLTQLTPENVARGDFKDAELLKNMLDDESAAEMANKIKAKIVEAGSYEEFIKQNTQDGGHDRDNSVTGQGGELDPEDAESGDYTPEGNAIDASTLFDERPQYEIPPEVQQMLDEYNTGAGKIEGLYETSRDEILGEARRARKESIGALQQSQDEALDIFKGRAYGNMPGYQQSLEQYGQQMAGGVRSVRERAGSGGAGLGAVADIYSSQQQGINQLGIANAQYMGARQGELGDMVRQTGLDMSGAYRTLAQDYINANLQSTGQLGGAYQAGTGMRTAGMANMANYKDVQFGLNEMQPYQQELQFNIDEMRRTDPFEAEMAMNMAKYGVQYQGWQQATQGVTNATQSMWNAPAKGAGDWAQAYQVDQWLGGPPRK